MASAIHYTDVCDLVGMKNFTFKVATDFVLVFHRPKAVEDVAFPPQAFIVLS